MCTKCSRDTVSACLCVFPPFAGALLALTHVVNALLLSMQRATGDVTAVVMIDNVYQLPQMLHTNHKSLLAGARAADARVCAPRMQVWAVC